MYYGSSIDNWKGDTMKDCEGKAGATNLRWEKPIRDAIRVSAAVNRRSMNAEILDRLARDLAAHPVDDRGAAA